MADTSTEQVGSDLSPSSSHTNTNTNKEGILSRPAKLFRGVSESFSESRPPVGMFAAYGHYASNVPTMADIQDGSYSPEGEWSGPGQRRNSQAHRASDDGVLQEYRERKMSMAEPVIKEEPIVGVEKVKSESVSPAPSPAPHDRNKTYPNGYQFPPKHEKWQATKILARGFGRYVITPTGFLITIYSLNVVAWGGMLFLILCHATPAMAHPSYNDDYSSAKIWLEITAQILTALFCVTGLGLIPWRFRDLYYLLQWRWRKNHDGIRRLAGIHRGWFRLQGSQEIDPLLNPAEEVPSDIDESTLAIPVKLSPSPPLTGERAPPTAYWKLDLVIWAFVINTFLQIMLCGFMWGMNRFDRPGAVVGLLISVACIVAMVGGWYIFKEGKGVKKIEGVPVSKEDMQILEEMRTKEMASSTSNAV